MSNYGALEQSLSESNDEFDISSEGTSSDAPRSTGSRVAKLSGGVILFVLAGLMGLMYTGNLPIPSLSQAMSGKTLAASPVRTRAIQLMESPDRSVKYDDLSDDDKVALFSEFKSKYGRSYKDSKEESKRFSYFKKFLKKIDERNAKEEASGSTAVHAVTIFADLSHDEFKSRYLGYKENKDNKKRNKHYVKSEDIKPVDKTSTTVMNWASSGYTTAVRDQGYCGSCWAFSAAEQIESDAILAGYLDSSTYLSVQQIVSCDTTDLGCDGGDTETAYEYVIDAGGIETEDDYPYSSYYDVTGTCSDDSDDYEIKVKKYYTLSSEDDMETYVLGSGPLSVCVAADTWASYSSGVITTCSTEVDHCVQVVGLNLASETEGAYWLVRNSWGTYWGEKGYIKVRAGEDLCKIANDPTYTSVKQVSRRK